MKKNVLVYGTIAGVIQALMLIATTSFVDDSDAMMDSIGMVLGFASMIIALSLIFVAVKNYRDKYNHGVISFGKAFQIGLLISLIAATFYVVTWAIEYHFFFPDFMDKYTAAAIEQERNSGDSPGKMAVKIKELESARENYKNPIYFTLITYAEIIPVGLIISLICAAILRRQHRPAAYTGNQQVV